MRLLVLVLLVIPLVSFAQEGRNEHSVSNGHKFVPYPVLQFAGGIGMFSGGVSHVYTKSKLETHLLIGHVPKSKAGRALWILTLKQSYFPFKVDLFRKSRSGHYLYPISVGTSISIYNFKSQNGSELPFFINSVLYNYFIGGKIGIQLKKEPYRVIEFYYEIGSNYIETYTYYINQSTIDLGDIINLGIGCSLRF